VNHHVFAIDVADFQVSAWINQRSTRWERTRPSNNPPIRQGLNEATSRLSDCLPGSQMGISGMKNLRKKSAADFAGQKQEWALHFRDSSHSRGEIRDRTLRSARENRQNDLSLSF
jgi:hypothetical protein